MLSSTILTLCRNCLPYKTQICVEGLLGITLDSKEIFLVNISETLEKHKGPLMQMIQRNRRTIKKTQKVKRKSESCAKEAESDLDEESSLRKRRRQSDTDEERTDKSQVTMVTDGRNESDQESVGNEFVNDDDDNSVSDYDGGNHDNQMLDSETIVWNVAQGEQGRPQTNVTGSDGIQIKKEVVEIQQDGEHRFEHLYTTITGGSSQWENLPMFSAGDSANTDLPYQLTQQNLVS